MILPGEVFEPPYEIADVGADWSESEWEEHGDRWQEQAEELRGILDEARNRK